MKPLFVILIAVNLFFVSCAPTNNINRSGQILDETSQKRHDYFFEHKKSEATSAGEVILTILAVVTIIGIVILLNDIQGDEREGNEPTYRRQIVVEENHNYYYGYERAEPQPLIDLSPSISESDKSKVGKAKPSLKIVKKKTLFETGVEYVKITNPYPYWVIGDLTTTEFENGDLKQVAISPYQTIKLYLPKGVRYTYTYHIGQEENTSQHLFQVRKQEITLDQNQAIAYD